MKTHLLISLLCICLCSGLNVSGAAAVRGTNGIENICHSPPAINPAWNMVDNCQTIREINQPVVPEQKLKVCYNAYPIPPAKPVVVVANLDSRYMRGKKEHNNGKDTDMKEHNGRNPRDGL